MDERFVHCPACGEPFVAAPRMANATMYGSSVSFAFRDQHVDHECKEWKR